MVKFHMRFVGMYDRNIQMFLEIETEYNWTITEKDGEIL